MDGWDQEGTGQEGIADGGKQGLAILREAWLNARVLLASTLLHPTQSPPLRPPPTRGLATPQ